jgi:hypothetical protein
MSVVRFMDDVAGLDVAEKTVDEDVSTFGWTLTLMAKLPLDWSVDMVTDGVVEI